jgi:hypothetical protein
MWPLFLVPKKAPQVRGKELIGGIQIAILWWLTPVQTHGVVDK